MPAIAQRTAARADAGRDLVTDAEKLIPQLRERLAEGDRLRKVPKANIDALRASPLLRVWQARRYGGLQRTARTHVDVVSTIARGCHSTGWCSGVFHAHSWLMAHFPQDAQEEVFGADPNTIISAVLTPRGTLHETEGGYRLNGFWPFASGCEHSQWLFLGALRMNARDEVVDEVELLMPTRDVTIRDDWNVVGLRATGSNSVAAEDLFIPQHRYLSLRDLLGGTTPGAALHDGALYQSAPVPLLALALVPCSLGMAKNALEAFRERLPGREVSYTFGEKQIDMPVTHMQLAEAATKIDVAEALTYRIADEIDDTAARGEAMEFTRRARIRMDCAWAARQCLEAVEILYLASGGSGIAESSIIGRAWRDLHAVNMHGLLNLQTNLEMYGRALLGLEPNSPLI